MGACYFNVECDIQYSGQAVCVQGAQGERTKHNCIYTLGKNIKHYYPIAVRTYVRGIIWGTDVTIQYITQFECCITQFECCNTDIECYVTQSESKAKHLGITCISVASYKQSHIGKIYRGSSELGYTGLVLDRALMCKTDRAIMRLYGYHYAISSARHLIVQHRRKEHLLTLDSFVRTHKRCPEYFDPSCR